MNFKRLNIPVRTVNAAKEVTYRVNPAREGQSNARFVITLRRDVAIKADLQPGACVEIAVDEKARHGQLLHVMRSHRKMTATAPEGHCRVQFSCPYVLDLPRLFPGGAKVTPLIFIEATKENGVIFELPGGTGA